MNAKENAEVMESIRTMEKEVDRCRQELKEASWKDWQGEMAAAAPTGHRLMRDWFAVPELAWHNVGKNNWRATWNNIEIGGYCSEPSEHREGCSVWWGNTKFVTVIRTGEEARAALNAKFLEWLQLATTTFQALTPSP